MTLGNRIKLIRDNEELSMADFAKRINVSPATINQWEKSKHAPSPSAMYLIAETFNINEEWLRTGNGEMKAPPTKNAIAASIAADLYNMDEESFKFRLITALSKATPEQLEVIEQIVNNIVKGGE